MKRFAMILATSLCTVPAFAQDTTVFTCQLETIPGETFQFKVNDLGTDSPQFDYMVSNDDGDLVFVTESKNQDLNHIVDTLNGQGGDMRVSDDRIEFFGDSAGIDFVYLDLYKNTAYKRGFLRTDFDFNTEQSYSKVSCRTKKQ